MDRRRRIWLVAVVIFAGAWFLQVHKDGTSLSQGGVPGWQAFRLAMSPVWAYDGESGGDETTVAKILTVASGSTNFVFLAAMALLWRRPSASVRLGIGLVLIAGFAFNWYWFFGGAGIESMRAGLRAGYYAWVTSFLVLLFA
jgi:hypothetical protein